jgi:hypothetical protein
MATHQPDLVSKADASHPHPHPAPRRYHDEGPHPPHPPHGRWLTARAPHRRFGGGWAVFCSGKKGGNGHALGA